MSSTPKIASAEFVLPENPGAAAQLKVTYDGGIVEHFTHNNSEFVSAAGKLEGTELKTAIEHAAKGVASTGSLKPHQYEGVLAIANDLEATAYKGSVSPLQHVLDSEPYHAAYKDALHADTLTAANGRKDLANLRILNDSAATIEGNIPEQLKRDFNLSFATPEARVAYDADIRKGNAFVKDVQAAKFGSAELYPTTGAAQKKMDAILKAHYDPKTGLQPLKQWMTPEADALLVDSHELHAGGMRGAINSFENRVKQSTEFLTGSGGQVGQKGVAEEIKNYNTIIEQNTGWRGNKKALAAAQKGLETLEVRLTEHATLHGDAHAVAFSALDKGEQQMLKSFKSYESAISKAATGVGSSVAAAAGQAAEAGRTWGAKLTEFKFSEGYLEQKVAKNKLVGKEAEEMMAKAGNMRWGKTALVGAGVLAAIYAGFSMFGSKKQEKPFAERVDESRMVAAGGRGA
ncbi:MAG: hypothetical protein B7X02_00060 [Rhodospirillales bacterium 12-54-5]|nr:MAG: hypothetical protein B7X02_00060 [Rhodospirillales bacterium 12-54-5]